LFHGSTGEQAQLAFGSKDRTDDVTSVRTACQLHTVMGTQHKFTERDEKGELKVRSTAPEADRKTNRQTGRWTERQTHRHTDTHRHTQTHTHTHTHTDIPSVGISRVEEVLADIGGGVRARHRAVGKAEVQLRVCGKGIETGKADSDENHGPLSLTSRLP
jgi:hypothetical protein